MKKFIVLILTLATLISGSLGISPVSASETSVLTAARAVTVHRSTATNQSYTSDKVWISTGGNGAAVGYFQFDLTGIDKSKIESAKLQFSYNQNNKPYNSTKVYKLNYSASSWPSGINNPNTLWGSSEFINGGFAKATSFSSLSSPYPNIKHAGNNAEIAYDDTYGDAVTIGSLLTPSVTVDTQVEMNLSNITALTEHPTDYVTFLFTDDGTGMNALNTSDGKSKYILYNAASKPKLILTMNDEPTTPSLAQPVIASPTSGSAFTEGSNVSLTLSNAAALVTDGAESVQWYNGTTPIGAPVTASPFSTSISNAPLGEYNIKAVASYPTGDPVESAAVAFRVARFSETVVNGYENNFDGGAWTPFSPFVRQDTQITDGAWSIVDSPSGTGGKVGKFYCASSTATDDLCNIGINPLSGLTSGDVVIKTDLIFSDKNTNRSFSIWTGSPNGAITFNTSGYVTAQGVSGNAGAYDINKVYSVKLIYHVGSNTYDLIITEDGQPFITRPNLTWSGANIDAVTRYKFSVWGATASPSTTYIDNFFIGKLTEVEAAPKPVITAPVANASFEYGGNVTLSVDSAPLIGSNVEKVEYFNGSASLGYSTTAPFSLTLTSPAAKSYTVTAVATYPGNLTSVSNPVTFKVAKFIETVVNGYENNFNSQAWSPITTWLQPIDTVGGAWSFDANPKTGDPNDKAAKFTVASSTRTDDLCNMGINPLSNLTTGDIIIKTDVILADKNTNRGITIWTNSSNGSINFGANGYVTVQGISGNAGEYSINKVYSIRLEYHVGSNLYSVTITEDGQPFISGTDINWSGTVTSVTRYKFGISGVTASPSTTYVDNFFIGTRTEKPPVIGADIAITSPLAGTYSPKSFDFTVSIDSDTAIKKVAYYDGAALIGETAVAPYNFKLLNAAIGTHSVTAKAISDDDEILGASEPVVLNITSGSDSQLEKLDFETGTAAIFSPWIAPGTESDNSQTIITTPTSKQFQMQSGAVYSSNNESQNATKSTVYSLAPSGNTAKPLIFSFDITKFADFSETFIGLRFGTASSNDREIIILNAADGSFKPFNNAAQAVSYIEGTKYNFRTVIYVETMTQEWTITNAVDGSPVANGSGTIGGNKFVSSINRIKLSDNFRGTTTPSITLFDNVFLGILADSPEASDFIFKSTLPSPVNHVSYYGVPSNTETIQFKFNQTMDAATITPSSIELVQASLEGVPVAISTPVLSASDNKSVTFNILGKLIPNAEYKIKFASTIKSAAGLSVPQNYTVSFLTKESDFDIIGVGVKKGNNYISSISAVNAGDTLSVIPVITNNKSASVTVRVIAAAYSGDNALIAVSSREVTVNGGVTLQGDDTQLSIQLGSVDSGTILRVLIWDSFDDMTSLVFPKRAL